MIFDALNPPKNRFLNHERYEASNFQYKLGVHMHSILTPSLYWKFDSFKFGFLCGVSSGTSIYSLAMKTLYIETSTEKSFIAIEDGSFFLKIPLSGGPDLSKKLGLEVNKLLKDNNFHPEVIAIGKGPGSLTGVRVGAALGKALAFGWSIPLIEFCSLKIFSPKEEGPFAVLIDARMAGIHVLIGGTPDHIEAKPQLLSPSNVEELVREIPLLVSPHPWLIEKRISRGCLEAFPLDLKPPVALR